MIRTVPPRALAAALVLAAYLPPPLRALPQEPDGEQGRELPESRWMERDRERMHPADPLELSGRGTAGDSARVPGLVLAARAPAQLDPDEQRARALALFGERALLNRPPSRRAPEEAPAPERGAAAGKPAAEAPPERDPGPSWWLHAFLFVALSSLAFWLLARIEARSRAPQALPAAPAKPKPRIRVVSGPL